MEVYRNRKPQAPEALSDRGQVHVEGPRFSLRLSTIMLALIFVLLVLVGVAFLVRQNNERQVKLAEGDELRTELSALEEEAARLDRAEAMADQPQYIEQLARDELGMVQEGEIIFKDVE
jgi:cell division protein FtsB